MVKYTKVTLMPSLHRVQGCNGDLSHTRQAREATDDSLSREGFVIENGRVHNYFLSRFSYAAWVADPRQYKAPPAERGLRPNRLHGRGEEANRMHAAPCLRELRRQIRPQHRAESLKARARRFLTRPVLCFLGGQAATETSPGGEPLRRGVRRLDGLARRSILHRGLRCPLGLPPRLVDAAGPKFSAPRDPHRFVPPPSDCVALAEFSPGVQRNRPAFHAGLKTVRLLAGE
jgi:hypothetical protein